MTGWTVGKHAANITQQTLTWDLSTEESRYTEKHPAEREVKKLGCIWRDIRRETGREIGRNTTRYWEGCWERNWDRNC